MGANFKQNTINTREILNALQSHHHNSQYQVKGTVLGKNLLINSDKSVSQRDDFSTPAAATSTEYYLDRFLVIFGGIAVDRQSKPFDVDAEGSIMRYEATSTATGYMLSQQIIENDDALKGKTVTYTARVKSNYASRIAIAYGIAPDIVYSSPHAGTGGWETLSLTVTLPTDITTLSVYVTTLDSAGGLTAMTSGDYFEVGNEQLELGTEFTGFEIVSPAINLINCQRYYQHAEQISSSNLYGTAGLTLMHGWAYLYPVEMRADPTASIKTTTVSTNLSAVAILTSERGAVTRGTVVADGKYQVGNGNAWHLDAEL